MGGAGVREPYLVGFVAGRCEGCAAIMVRGEDRRSGNECDAIIRRRAWSGLYGKVSMTMRCRVGGVVIRFVAFHGGQDRARLVVVAVIRSSMFSAKGTLIWSVGVLYLATRISGAFPFRAFALSLTLL